MRRLLLAALCLCLGLVACSDDDPVTPGKFQVTVKVVDDTGAPVEGILVNTLSDNPYLQDKVDKRKASVRIQFVVLTPSHARMVIRDIEENVIRTVLDSDLVAGVHQIVWDGFNDARIHQHSGRYTAHLVVTAHGTGETLFEDRLDMLMCLMDPVRSPAGTTDADGKLALTDTKLFPHLYDRPAMVASDESAENIGALETTASMIFTMADTVRGGSMVFRREVTGPGELEFVWNPAPRAVQAGPAAEITTQRTPPVDDPVYQLGPAFPVPFN